MNQFPVMQIMIQFSVRLQGPIIFMKVLLKQGVWVGFYSLCPLVDSLFIHFRVLVYSIMAFISFRLNSSFCIPGTNVDMQNLKPKDTVHKSINCFFMFCKPHCTYLNLLRFISMNSYIFGALFCCCWPYFRWSPFSPLCPLPRPHFPLSPLFHYC